MKQKVLACVLALTLIVCITFPGMSRADFGDFSGDTDFGSIDWDTGSDWGSDWGSSDWDDDWDDDEDWSIGGPIIYNTGGFGGGYSDGYSNGYGDDDSFSDTLFVALIVILIVIFVLRRMNAQQQANKPAGAQMTSLANLKTMAEYQTLDEGFDEAAFKEKLANIYVKMQNAWQDKDIEPVQPYFTDALYQQMARQVEAYRKNRRTNYIEKIAVMDVVPRGFYQQNGQDHIIALVRARIVDYTLDDTTGKLLAGSQTMEKFMLYEWDLARESGVITGKTDGATVVNCPRCGAPISINATAKCPYCDSVIIVEQKDWAINSIKAVGQQTR